MDRYPEHWQAGWCALQSHLFLISEGIAEFYEDEDMALDVYGK